MGIHYLSYLKWQIDKKCYNSMILVAPIFRYNIRNVTVVL